MRATEKQIEFGYHPPAGERLIERVAPASFTHDLERVLGLAAPAFDAVWVSDHFMTNDRFRMECWTQLVWIAAHFPQPRLGTIVLANSYRHPPLLAKMAASLHYLSGGRLILGYGAGWAEDEYRAYGYDVPPARVRVEQMSEGVELMRALWTGRPVTYEGRHYRLVDALAVPAADPPPPIMIGGEGERYTLPAVARHADWWNSLHRPMDTLRRKLALLDEHCAAIGRHPATLRRTLVLTVFLARSGRNARRAAGHRLEGEAPAFAGEPNALVDHLASLAELGFDHLQLVFADFPQTTDIELFLERVRPAFSSAGDGQPRAATQLSSGGPRD